MDSREIERIASHWLARREGGQWDATAQQALQAWLEQDTAHRVAWLRLSAAWDEAGRLQALGAGLPRGQLPPRGTWTGRGAAATDASAMPPQAPVGDAWDLRALRFAARAPTERRRRWPQLLAATAAALGLLAIVFHAGLAPPPRTDTYASAVGDLRTQRLADGTDATLSSDSRIAVTLSAGERHVELQRGEAFFHAAKDPARPFVVAAGARQVVAVGTRFSVRRGQDELRVVVTEGLVRLQPSPGQPATAPTTLLPAGSIALVGPHGVLVRSPGVAEAERALDWRQGLLTFQDSTLAAAVAEFNRYNTRKLELGDAATAQLRVAGQFRWANVDAFVRLLEQGFPVRAERHKDRVVLRQR
ncbi:FecR family protein [Pseudoxanthomonas composti]|uniref:DUF4880 domain-containing protein n=1 Tax=Pseudoxanthomonas composti TaxID=2137479 RepID=A0A4Q1JW58_9GAMM|nr:FecR domain-containing protein [Pseudoxanthomonas composti]RXR06532.1 DUF4880 domain-containing protein [Pseudoxanthomonas composti]